MGPVWVAFAVVLSDLSIPVHMLYAHALADLYVAERVLRETINPSAHHQFQQDLDKSKQDFSMSTRDWR